MLINAMTAMLVAINKKILVMVRSRVAVVSSLYIVACAVNFNSMDRWGAEHNIKCAG